jgi:hypothetical protein
MEPLMTGDCAKRAFVRLRIAAARQVQQPPLRGTAAFTEGVAGIAPESLSMTGETEPPDTKFIGESLDLAAENLRRDEAVDGDARDASLAIAREAYTRMQDGFEIDLQQAVHVEAIQIFDGTRPAICVDTNGNVPHDSPELGDWARYLALQGGEIAALVNSVALIKVNGVPLGTGFRAGPGVLLTNRHVLEGMATETSAGWVPVDGSEAVFLTGTEAITGVTFAGAQTIGGVNDLSRLDAAVLRLSGQAGPPVSMDGRLTSDSPQWPIAASAPLQVIGYPLGLGDVAGLAGAERLYQGKIGRLCWSPGYMTILPGQGFGDEQREWAFGYDVSTLPGNSGSLVADLRGDPFRPIGLHIGGATQMGNWAHWLAATSNQLVTGNVSFAS